MVTFYYAELHTTRREIKIPIPTVYDRKWIGIRICECKQAIKANHLHHRRVSRQKSKHQREEELGEQLKLKHKLSTQSKLIEEEEEERGSVSDTQSQTKFNENKLSAILYYCVIFRFMQGYLRPISLPVVWGVWSVSQLVWSSIVLRWLVATSGCRCGRMTLRYLIQKTMLRSGCLCMALSGSDLVSTLLTVLQWCRHEIIGLGLFWGWNKLHMVTIIAFSHCTGTRRG